MPDHAGIEPSLTKAFLGAGCITLAGQRDELVLCYFLEQEIADL